MVSTRITTKLGIVSQKLKSLERNLALLSAEMKLASGLNNSLKAKLREPTTTTTETKEK